MTVRFPLAERFKAPQGEGLYAGTPMAFMRTVGCSVGQKICTACDTDFTRQHIELGGGSYTVEELVAWADKHRHICITGGEPLDRDIRPLLHYASDYGYTCHIETSGTRRPDWLDPTTQQRPQSRHEVDGRWLTLWVTVSPKPGYDEHMVLRVADEVKVIIGGLGDGPGWPTLDDAVRWADSGKLVYVQPRNFHRLVDEDALEKVIAHVDQYPQLRLSTQLHKFIGVR